MSNKNEKRGLFRQLSSTSLEKLKGGISSIAHHFKKGDKEEVFPVVEVQTLNVLSPTAPTQGQASTPEEKREKFGRDLEKDVTKTFDQNTIRYLANALGFDKATPDGQAPTTEQAHEKAREFAKANPKEVLPTLVKYSRDNGAPKQASDKELARELVGNPVDALQESIGKYRKQADKLGVPEETQKQAVKNACDQFMKTAVAYGLGDAIREEMTLRQQGDYIGSTKNVKRVDDLSKGDWKMAEESMAAAKQGPWQKASHTHANENHPHKPLDEILSKEERQNMRKSIGEQRSAITGTHGLPMQGKGKESDHSR